MKGKVVLVVDDEASLRTILRTVLEREGYEVILAENARQALQVAETRHLDIVVTDLIMPDRPGTELVKSIKQLQPSCAAIVMTAFASIKTAVEAMRLGAYNYITKPFDLNEIRAMVRSAMSEAANENGNSKAKRSKPRNGANTIIGESPRMRELFDLIDRAADARTTVLIRGESGTGKELVARALHYRSSRADKPFIAVSCAALPETLLESELFGHEKSAFTGAAAMKPGRFELANEGTLFLDEIGEISPAIQVKLLRVLQERSFERLGGTRSLQTDVRVITATNRDLEEACKSGTFREDLYFRLQVIQLTVPPLRDRKEDIMLLADHFVEKFCQENQRPKIQLGQDIVDALLAYSYPGNVRELENAIERIVVLSDRTSTSADASLLPPRMIESNKPV